MCYSVNLYNYFPKLTPSLSWAYNGQNTAFQAYDYSMQIAEVCSYFFQKWNEEYNQYDLELDDIKCSICKWC